MEESRFLFFKLIVSVVMSYISYFFLTGLIFGTVAVFFVILINLGLQDFSVQFFRLFSFIVPKTTEEKFSINFGDILKIFSFIALIPTLGKIIWSKFSKTPPNKTRETAKRKIILLVVFITVVYAIAFLSFILGSKFEASNAALMYLIIVRFFIVTLLSGIFYLLFSSLEKYLLAFSDNNLVTG